MCTQRSIINYDGVALFTLDSVPSKVSICATNRSEKLFEQHNKKDRSLKAPKTSENSVFVILLAEILTQLVEKHDLPVAPVSVTRLSWHSVYTARAVRTLLYNYT